MQELIPHKDWFHYFGNQWDMISNDSLKLIYIACCQKDIPKEYDHELFEMDFDSQAVKIHPFIERRKAGEK